MAKENNSFQIRKTVYLLSLIFSWYIVVYFKKCNMDFPTSGITSKFVKFVLCREMRPEDNTLPAKISSFGSPTKPFVYALHHLFASFAGILICFPPGFEDKTARDYSSKAKISEFTYFPACTLSSFIMNQKPSLCCRN